jgi:uncharacterized protein (DUF983 family)
MRQGTPITISASNKNRAIASLTALPQPLCAPINCTAPLDAKRGRLSQLPLKRRPLCSQCGSECNRDFSPTSGLMVVTSRLVRFRIWKGIGAAQSSKNTLRLLEKRAFE